MPTEEDLKKATATLQKGEDKDEIGPITFAPTNDLERQALSNVAPPPPPQSTWGSIKDDGMRAAASTAAGVLGGPIAGSVIGAGVSSRPGTPAKSGDDKDVAEWEKEPPAETGATQESLGALSSSSSAEQLSTPSYQVRPNAGPAQGVPVDATINAGKYGPNGRDMLENGLPGTTTKAIAAEKATGEADAQEAKGVYDILDNFNTRADERAATAESRRVADQASVEARNADISRRSDIEGARRVDTGRIFKKPSYIGTAISAAMLAFVAGRQGRDPSIGIQMIDRSIQQDIQEQKDDIAMGKSGIDDEKNNLAAFARISGDRRQGELLYEAQAYKAAANKVRAMGAKFQGPKAILAAEKISSALEEQGYKRNMDAYSRVYEQEHLVNPLLKPAWQRRGGIMGTQQNAPPEAPQAPLSIGSGSSAPTSPSPVTDDGTTNPDGSPVTGPITFGRPVTAPETTITGKRPMSPSQQAAYAAVGGKPLPQSAAITVPTTTLTSDSKDTKNRRVVDSQLGVEGGSRHAEVERSLLDAEIRQAGYVDADGTVSTKNGPHVQALITEKKKQWEEQRQKIAKEYVPAAQSSASAKQLQYAVTSLESEFRAKYPELSDIEREKKLNEFLQAGYSSVGGETVNKARDIAARLGYESYDSAVRKATRFNQILATSQTDYSHAKFGSAVNPSEAASRERVTSPIHSWHLVRGFAHDASTGSAALEQAALSQGSPAAQMLYLAGRTKNQTPLAQPGR